MMTVRVFYFVLSIFTYRES